MRRVVAVWLPTWPTDRLRRNPGAPSPEMPLITAANDGRRMVVAAADRAALALGIRPAMPLAHARAMVPGLTVVDADPEGDAAALARLSARSLRYSPLTASDPPDGVWIDITGCDHLHGREAAMLADLLQRLGRGGTHARAAVADTPGAGHGVTRFATDPAAVIAPGAHQAGSNETTSWYTFGDKSGTRRVASGAKSMTYPVPESGGTAGGVSENI